MDNSQESPTVRFAAWSSPSDTPKTFWGFGIEPPPIETWWTDSEKPSKRFCNYLQAPTPAWNTSPTKMQSPIDLPFETPTVIGRTAADSLRKVVFRRRHQTRATDQVRGWNGNTLNHPAIDATATVHGVKSRSNR